ncbi:MAG: helix-turn-helix transcriptional regulator [Clostridia bacterium]|nr:helix-turn-helix transcriptional regulator [Clostridia bacterium]
MKTISVKIRERRVELGLSQKALAEKSELSSRSVFAYEAGEKVPRPATVIRIAAALGVSPEYLTNDGMEYDENDIRSAYLFAEDKRFSEQVEKSASALLSDNIAFFRSTVATQAEKDSFFEGIMRAYLMCKGK